MTRSTSLFGFESDFLACCEIYKSGRISGEITFKLELPPSCIAPSCDFNSIKMRAAYCLAVLALVACYADSASAQNKIVCYFGSWAGYRLGNGKFPVESINPKLCTHLIYSFVGIDATGGIRVLDPWNDLPSPNLNGFGRFNALKLQSPGVKTLVAVGGWNEGSWVFSQVMANPATRAAFIDNAIAFVQKYNFDGFDLDWEYPAQRGGAAADKGNFALLLKEMRVKFDQKGLLLSAAVAAGQNSVQTSYDVPALSRYLDFINVMTYDLHGPWEAATGQNAPLFASSADRTAEALQLNVNASIHYWISQGAAPSKLILGMGTYGRSFALSSLSGLLGAAASGPGPLGVYTREAGMLGYNEICELQKGGGWKVTWDDEQKVPFTSSGTTWIGYDDSRSIRAKSEFALSLGLGGGMIWSLETDDFLGLCTGIKFPLLTTINEVLSGAGSATTTTATTTTASATTTTPAAATTTAAAATTTAQATTTTAQATTTTASAPASGICTKVGYVRDPVNCQVFYYCQLNFGKFLQSRYTCPANTVFDSRYDVCNFKSQVQC